MSAAGGVKAGRAYVEILLDQTKLEKGLKKAQAKLKNFGTSLTNMGKGLLSVGAVLAAPMALATKTFADFDDQMRTVKAVTGAAGEEFKSMTALAEKLGRETSFTAKEVASGMTALGRMGFKPKEIEQAIPAVLDLARATGTELSEAAEIASNNMRVFRINTSKTSRVADILTATANGSAQTLTDLGEALKMAGPQASAAGDNITNVSGALGILANMGIRGSLAGTALRKSYSQFAKTKVQEKLKAIGIATVDANGNLRSMPDIMSDIAKAMNAMPSAQRLSFAEEIFDLRGSLAGLQLGGNIKDLEAFIQTLKSASGTAANTAKEMDSGIGGAFRRLMSALEGVQIAFGRVISEALAPYVESLSKSLTNAAEWIAGHKKLILLLAKITAGVIAAGVAFIALGLAIKALAIVTGVLSALFTVLKVAILAPVVAVKGLIAAFALLKTAMVMTKVVAIAMWAAITTPAVLVGIALGALVAIVWKLTGAWDMCANALKGIGSDFSKAFKDIGEVMGKTWEAIKIALGSGDLAGAAKVGLAALKVAWLTGIFPLKKAWADFKYFLADSWTIVVYGLLKLGYDLWYGLLYGLKAVGVGIANAWDALWDGIIGAFEETIATIKKGWVRFKAAFDWSIDVDAEYASIDEETARSRNARQERSAADRARRERERGSLNKEWDDANAAIDQAMLQGMGENRDARDKALQGAQSEINAARDEWQKAMDAVKKNAEEQTAKKKEQEAKAAEAAANTDKAGAKVSAITGGKAAGAWTSAELNAMLGGGGSVAERTAKATEESVKQQKKTNQKLEQIAQNGAVYV